MSEPRLNDEQLRITTSLSGGILVLAPVGTGKTTVLTERVAQALQHATPPEHILCVTFTNRAAQEMQGRIASRFPQESARLTLRTFHALCADILRSEAKLAGLPAEFSVSDEDETGELLKAVGRRIARMDDATVRSLHRHLESIKAVPASELQWPPDYERLFTALHNDDLIRVATRYQIELAHRQELDYGDLVLMVRSLFAGLPDARERWSGRYQFVQVDEVQDTHTTEYEIIQILAENHGNLALIGDIDQSIYQWRGANPDGVLAQFRRDFAPVSEFHLRWNYRSPRRLLRAAESFSDSFQRRFTHVEPAPDSDDGEPIRVHVAADGQTEARWIAKQILAFANEDPDFSFRRVGVLAPTNRRRKAISDGLAALGVPHLTVEELEFFRRHEVKDALAYLKLLLNPSDAGSAIRVLSQPGSGVGTQALVRVQREGESVNLRLVDLLREETYDEGEPFGGIIEAFQHGTLAVFDVESTGLVEGRDEVVEIAAARIEHGQPVATFHRYLQSTLGVGQSELIHGLTDQYLREHGVDPRSAIQDFSGFSQGNLLVGHNVGFDVRIVSAQAAKLGLPFATRSTADTLILARRFLAARSYSLAGLAEELALRYRPTHRAEADVFATCELLERLVSIAADSSGGRREVVARERATFVPIANMFKSWRVRCQELRPPALLEEILATSGLSGKFSGEPKRQGNLKRLIEIFSMLDDLELSPAASLRNLISYTTLSKTTDYFDENENQVPVITIHQSKGLEFDVVFVAGLTDGELPRFYSVRDGRMEEERHLFYVALTRAKKRLFLTRARMDGAWRREGSPFLSQLDPEVLETV